MKKKLPYLYLSLPVIFFVVAFDQLTKMSAQRYLSFGERVPVIKGLFDLTLTYNRGAAFGLFAEIPDNTTRYILLGVTTILALGAVLYFLLVEGRQNRLGQMALCLIIGGAVGNIIDRVRLGVGVDFFLLYYKQWHWPVFNVADSFITIGVFLLILTRPKKRANAGNNQGSAEK